MARKNKKTQLSSEGKTELAKTIAEKGQRFAKTYASIEVKFSRMFRWCSGWLDKILFNQKHGKFVALILAIFFYMIFHSNDIVLFDNIQSVENLGDFPVVPIVSDQAYEVSNLPETVKVRIIGDISEIKNVKQQKNFRIVANLTDLTEGTHEVTLKSEAAPSHVEVVLEPSNALVTIKKKSIRSFTLGYDFVNRFNMDPIYDLSEPSLEQGEVYVRASNDTLDKIAFVKALIDVKKNYTSDFSTKAVIAAYDDQGNKLNVDIIPDTMNATVKVSKPSKVVPVTLVPNGTIPNKKAIESYSINHKEVSVYAEQSVLDNIHELPITVPASTLKSNREFAMPLIIPNGVTKISESVVNISVKLAEEKEKTIKDVPISFVNPVDGFDFGFLSTQESSADVTIKGAKKVIDKIKKEDIYVTVDLSKIDTAGEFELPITVTGKNKLVNYVLKDAITEVVVTQK